MAYKQKSPIPIPEGGTNATTLATTDGTVYYDGTRLVTTATGTSGWVLTSGGAGVAPAYAVLPASGIVTLNGNTGSATGTTVTITTGAGNTTGTTVFTGSGSTLTMSYVDAGFNLGIGGGGVLDNLTTGTFNVSLGYIANSAITSGVGNISIGYGSNSTVSTSNYNTAVGMQALTSLATGAYNVAIGGDQTGINYTGAESNNILIGKVAGTTGESNKLRIGSASGTGTGQLNAAFIQGIASVSVSNKQYVTIDTTTGQMGSEAGASALLTAAGDSGTATPSAGTITWNANTNGGKTTKFTATGSTVSFNATDASGNTFYGLTSGTNYSAGSGNTAFGLQSMGNGVIAANNNVAMGARSLYGVTSGAQNTAIGNDVMSLTTITGSFNTVLGYNALPQPTSASFNVCLGPSSGLQYTSSESSNIQIGYNNQGVTAESHVLRIGNGTGSGDGNLSAAYIYGIDGVNVGSVAKVLTMASDKIGTATITAGTNITVTPGANTITIASTGGTGFTWSVITANQTAAVNNGYICNKATTLTLALPAASAVGDIIEVTGINTATGWQLTQAANQQIFFGTSSTTLGATGTLTSSAIRDSLRIVCVVANLTWNVLSSVGNITVV